MASQRSTGVTFVGHVCAATAAAISLPSPFPALNREMDASTGKTEGSGSGGCFFANAALRAAHDSVALSNSEAAWRNSPDSPFIVASASVQ